MKIPPYKILEKDGAVLYGMPYPDFSGGLGSTLDLLVDQNVSILVNLLEESEENFLSGGTIRERCNKRGLDLRQFAIRDGYVPLQTQVFSDFVSELLAAFYSEHSIAVHCRAGIGRTGLVLTTIMGKMGCSLEEACVHVSTARGLQVPQTPGQFEWLRDNWEVLAQA